MHYIVFDLEFNQDFSSLQVSAEAGALCPFEIIQIGAVKLDSQWNTVATFNRYVKPVIYSKISPFITELTSITTTQLETEESFPEVYQAFLKFIEDEDSVFCTWGKTDMKEIFQNVSYHKLNQKTLPKLYINLQPYASLYFDLPEKRLLKLQSTVEELDLPLPYPFHNALHDAYYTAEIFKKIYQPWMQPKLYDPIYVNVNISTRQPKRKIDVEALLLQFEKMYHRQMTEEEQNIIKLAYQMGKTQQFLQ